MCQIESFQFHFCTNYIRDLVVKSALFQQISLRQLASLPNHRNTAGFMQGLHRPNSHGQLIFDMSRRLILPESESIRTWRAGWGEDRISYWTWTMTDCGQSFIGHLGNGQIIRLFPRALSNPTMSFGPGFVLFWREDNDH